MGKTNRLKLPNGYGSIRHLKGKRRNEYQVLGPAVYDALGHAKRPIIGYTTSWHDGYKMLLKFHDDPYDLDLKHLTFKVICEELKPKWLKDVERGKMSTSNYKNLINAYNNSKSLYEKEVLELRNRDFQNVIDNSKLGYTAKGYLKNIFGRVIKYCITELELPMKITNTDNLDIGTKEKSEKHQPFTNDEIKKIWEQVDNSLIEEKVLLMTAKMVLISIYTGLRPKALTHIETSKVHLDEDYFLGGCKTKAGKDRFIPIHPAIKTFIEEFYTSSNDYLIVLESTEKSITTDYYQKRFADLMELLELKHVPYDTRHTFATRADEVGISETNIKVLMGHSLSGDVTNSVYIHKSKELLSKEMKKLYFIEEGKR